MNGPFVGQAIAQQFVHSTLSASSAVTTALGGAGRIFPNISPSGVTTRHLAHQYYGRVAVVKPAGSPVAMVTMRWAITAWEPSFSQQALEPAMEAVMGLLIGQDTRGKTHRFTDDNSRVWSIYADYDDEDLVEVEVAPVGTWAPMRQVYTLGLQQLS